MEGYVTCHAGCELSAGWFEVPKNRTFYRPVRVMSKLRLFLRVSSFLGMRPRRVSKYNIYLLISWRKVLLEKLTSSQLFKKFLAFYTTRRSITAFTSARHLLLSWAGSIQSIPPHPTSSISISILSSHLRLGHPSDLLKFPHYNPVHTSLLPHTCYMPRPSHSSSKNNDRK